MVKSFNSFSYDILKKSQVNDLVERLSDWYGVDLSFLKDFYFYIAGRDKVYISKVDLRDLDFERVNSIGLYFGTFHDNNRFRLSIEGSQMVKVTKNFILISDEVLKSYLAAENLFSNEVEMCGVDGKASFVIVRYGDVNLGCVSIKEDVLLSYVPKSRKLDFNKVF